MLSKEHGPPASSTPPVRPFEDLNALGFAFRSAYLGVGRRTGVRIQQQGSRRMGSSSTALGMEVTPGTNRGEREWKPLEDDASRKRRI